MNRWKMMLAVAGLTLTCGTVLPLAAQQGGGGAGGGGGGGGGGGARFRFDPAEREKQFKTQLGVSDDEWKVLQPKIEKVDRLRIQVAMGGRTFGFGGRGGRGPGGGGADAAASQPASPLAQAQTDLQSALDNKDATPEQVKAKLEAFRAARTKAREELKKAQDELKEIITVRQEAVLVNRGTLE